MADESSKGKEDGNFIMGFKGIDEYSQEGFKRVIEATKAFQALPPAGPLWDLQKSYPEFSRAMRNSRTRIIPIMKTLLEHAKVQTHDFKRRDLEEKFDFIVESNDDILERIASALDDASGLSTRTEILVVNQSAKALKPPGTWGKRKPMDASADSLDSTLSRGKHFPTPPPARPVKKAVHRLRITEKPQLKFKVPIDNSITTPFIPILKDKPNSLKPLSILPEFNGKNEEFYGHPYQVELNRWEASPNHMTKVTPQIPLTIEKSKSLILVQTLEELESLLEDLRKVDEISVDVEHHSYRTFLGLTCLVQVSTRSQDYIIDTIALREDLGILNEIFTKPKIMKVFHGATSDIEWLQRDCGLYVVGMFDTHVAAKQLSLPQLSLQSLLSKYCQVAADKQYQLADWRIRPLPDDMLHYARQDTHYLLYLYDLLKNELIDGGNQFNNLLTSVYDESNMICLRRYEKPTLNPQLTLRKTRRALNNRQVYAFTEIFKWRDAIAREKDESLGYVLPNHMLFMIAESLPKEMTGILACCDPVPPLVHVNLGLLHRIVLKARDLPVHEEKVQAGVADKVKKLKNWVVIMNSIHDIEGDEVEGTKSKILEREDQITKTWPEPWESPVDMSGVEIRSKSTLLFQREKPNGTNPTQKRKSKQNIYTPGYNAFDRYELSCQILEMLRDPKRKDSVDMNDPTVKVVYDTIFVDPVAAEAASVKNLSVVNTELVNVLPKSDFVPFNPAVEHMKQIAEQSKKNRKKKVKHETWNDEPSYTSNAESDTLRDGVGLKEEGEIDDGDDLDSYVPLEVPKSQREESRRDRKKNKNKGRVIDKLKFWKLKRKYDVEGAQEHGGEDEDEVVCLDPRENEDNGPPAPKRFRDIQAERFPSPSTSQGSRDNSFNNSFGSRGRGGGSRGRDNGRGRGKGGGRGDNSQGKNRGKRGGFFNAFRRPEGRSVTYK